jgi:hypothetical protein
MSTLPPLQGRQLLYGWNQVHRRVPAPLPHPSHTLLYNLVGGPPRACLSDSGTASAVMFVFATTTGPPAVVWLGPRTPMRTHTSRPV